MKHFWKYLICILVIIALISCRQKGNESVKQFNGISTLEFPIEIDMEKFIDTEFKEIGLSSVVDSIEYIPLETTQSSLIGFIRQAVIADSFIFILTGEKILKFNREGKYLCQIGSLGRGPGQFIGLKCISIDDLRETLFICPNYSKDLIKYTYTNDYLGVQPMSSSDLAIYISYIGYNRYSAVGAWTPPDWKTEEMFIAAILDSSGRVVKKIDTPLRQFDNFLKRKDIQYPGTFSPTYFDSTAICLGYGCDTVFAITQDSIEVRYILSTGKYDAPLDIKYGFDSNTSARVMISEKKFNYIFFDKAPIETRDYLFLRFFLKGYMYLAAFNKLTDETIVFKKEGDVRFGQVVSVDDFGFMNDLDGGLYFYPRWTNLRGDVWIDAYDAFEFKAKLTSSWQFPNKNYSEKQKSLIQLVNMLDDNDNPVLMIAYVK